MRLRGDESRAMVMETAGSLGLPLDMPPHVYIVIAVTILCVRVLHVALAPPPRRPMDGPPLRTMVVLGSGGHTAEMFALLRAMSPRRYAPRHYVIADTDTTSRVKAEHHEAAVGESLAESSDVDDDELSIASEYSVGTIPRAREVGQGWIHSFFTTVRAAVHAAAVVFRERPHVLLCNGPGTCVPVVAWAFVARTLRPVTWFVGVGSRPAIVYVESAARTKTMSLTGRILYTTRLADEVFVQWEGLARRYPRAKFAGRVC